MLFSFAQEEEATKQEVVQRHNSLRISLAHVVEVDASAGDVSSGLAFGRGELSGDEEVGKQAGGMNFGFGERDGGDFVDELLEGFGADTLQRAAEEDFAGFHGVLRRLGAVNQLGDVLGQLSLGGSSLRRLGVFGCYGLDFFLGEKGKVFEIAKGVAVVGPHPKLVKSINACLVRIQPNGAFGGFAKLCPVRVGDERQSQSENRGS